MKMPFSKLAVIMLIAYLSSVRARSISIIGDVRIETGHGKFICDKIECPLNTERCVVSKEKDPKDDIILVRSNICYSETGDELQKSVTTETVNPNSQINVLIESYRSGGIRSINSIISEDFDEEAFAAEMDAFQKNLNRDMDDLEKELQQMNYDLVHMFD